MSSAALFGCSKVGNALSVPPTSITYNYGCIVLSSYKAVSIKTGTMFFAVVIGG